MFHEIKLRYSRILIAATTIVFLATGLARLPLHGAKSPPATSSDPWTSAQIVQPADLVKELAASQNASKPIVLCVGMRTYFKNAHVPGAVLHGPAMSQSGLE